MNSIGVWINLFDVKKSCTTIAAASQNTSAKYQIKLIFCGWWLIICVYIIYVLGLTL